MTTRLEKVRLELESNVARTAATDAAAIALLKREVDSLSRSGVQTSRASQSMERDLAKVGKSADSSGKQIDRFSGRLKILAQAASVLGPALIPLGAGMVPMIAGLTAELGAAAGATGVLILALKGVGDGLKALNDYQLEPTAENLEKVREQFEKLGPDGAHFVEFLDGVGEQLRDLQMTARAGLFPGMEDGITSMLDLLPQVQRIVGDLATTMGQLSSDAGSSLAGPDFEAFFNYLETDAAPTLDAFGRTVGNFARGFANILVAVAPATRDFTSGLEGMSRAFADWSAGLDSNESFQAFLDYIRESGPKALDFIGSLIMALADIAKAAAPIGDHLLPALTSLLDALGALADSPIGPFFFTAAAAISVYSRGLQAAQAVQDRFARSAMAMAFTQRGAMLKMGAQVAGFAAVASGLTDHLGLTNTATLGLAGSFAGPWGAAIGAAIGLTQDLSLATEGLAAATRDANAATDDEGLASLISKRNRLQAELDALPTGAHGLLSAAATTLTGGDFDAPINEARAALDRVNQAIAVSRGEVGDLSAVLLGPLSKSSHAAAESIDDFANSFANLNSLLDRSGSLIAYEEALDSLTASVKKNGQAWDAGTAAGRENLQARNTLIQKAIERSEVLKKAGDALGAQRVLRRAIGDLQRFSDDSPKAKAKIDFLIKALKDLDKQNAKPTADVDPKPAQRHLDDLDRQLADWDRGNGEATATVNGSQAMSELLGIKRLLDGLHNKTIYMTTVTRRVGAGGQGNGYSPSADGGTVPKTGLPYADRHPYLLADGEEVISNRFGQADRNRHLLKMINAGRLANGGTAGAGRNGGDPQVRHLQHELDVLAHKLNLAGKAVDAEREQRDRLRQASQALASTASGNFTGSLWGREGAWGSGGGWRSALMGDIRAARGFNRDLRQLKAKGLGGQAFAAIASEDPSVAAQMSSLSRKQLAEYERLYGIRQHVAQRAGRFAGDTVYGHKIDVSNEHLAALNAKVDRLEREQRQTNHKLEQQRKEHHGHAKRTGDAVGDKINKASRAGERGGRPVVK